MNKQFVQSVYSKKDAERELKGIKLKYSDLEALRIKILPREDIEYRTPEGKLVAMFLAGVFSAQEQDERELAFSQVDGDLRNRPEVFGRGARQQLIRKDGLLSPRVGTPAAVLEAGGSSGLYGPYRYKNKAPGVPHCQYTSQTLARPDLYARMLPIAARVTDIYRRVLPNEYRVQMEYIDALLPEWKLPNSAFTDIYAINNRPTAVHQDKFDIPTATGVITTSGWFSGNEFCLPEYGIAFDIRPSDILFADVHAWHGNLPRTNGDRVGQVYFVRKGMHECPAAD